MTDTAPSTPETPPAAPPVTPNPPDQTGEVQQVATEAVNLLGDAMPPWAQTLLFGGLYDYFQGDIKLWEYREKDPKKFDQEVKEYTGTTLEINTQEDLGKLAIAHKMMLLLQTKVSEWFGSDEKSTPSEGTESAAPTLPEELKAKMKEFKFADFKSYHEGKQTKDLLFKEDSPHAIWTGDKVLFGFEALEAETLDEPGEVEKWPDIFPYMPGTRVVLGGKSKDEVTKLNNWAKPFFEKGGVKLTVVTDGNPAAAPAADEIQVMATTESEPLDWDQVRLCQELWNGETPVQFSQCLKTLAAVQVLEGLEPAAACEFVGLKEPTEAFLKELTDKRTALDA